MPVPSRCCEAYRLAGTKLLGEPEALPQKHTSDQMTLVRQKGLSLASRWLVEPTVKVMRSSQDGRSDQRSTAPPRSLSGSFLPRAARQCIRPKRIPLATACDKNDSADAGCYGGRIFCCDAHGELSRGARERWDDQAREMT
jgi:hypothetical protein